MATQQLGGNPWSMGTRNWRQPDQWPMSSIMQIRLKILMKTLAMLRNWLGTSHAPRTNEKSLGTGERRRRRRKDDEGTGRTTTR